MSVKETKSGGEKAVTRMMEMELTQVARLGPLGEEVEVREAQSLDWP